LARDVTEQKLAADRLRQAEEQLRQAQKLETVGQLTAGVAHDFNNLLTSVLGSLELLPTSTADDSARRLLRSAIRAAQRGAKLNQQLPTAAPSSPTSCTYRSAGWLRNRRCDDVHVAAMGKGSQPAACHCASA
jgi:C4-dicarboxylate-specific signal transduction histidine kinase